MIKEGVQAHALLSQLVVPCGSSHITAPHKVQSAMPAPFDEGESIFVQGGGRKERRREGEGRTLSFRPHSSSSLGLLGSSDEGWPKWSTNHHLDDEMCVGYPQHGLFPFRSLWDSALVHSVATHRLGDSLVSPSPWELRLLPNTLLHAR